MNYPKPENISNATMVPVVFKFTPWSKKPIKASNKSVLTPELKKIALIIAGTAILYGAFLTTRRKPKKVLKKE